MRFACAAVAALMTCTALPALAETPNRAQLAASVKGSHDANLKRLQDWIANPTIAAEKTNVDGGAEYMRKRLLDAGFQQARVVKTDGVPGVFATLDAGAPTTLGIYFMYDVKQYDPKEWSSPPLEGRLVDRAEGKAIVGRGAVNQKGPETAFLAALHAFKDTGRKLPVNIVLVAEGEEEIASPHFRQIVSDPEAAAALKKTIGVIIPGAGQESNGATSIDLGAKGVIEVQLISSGEHWGRGPAKDVHSSLKANLDSPAWRLVKALNTLVAEDGQTPAIDGWFDNVKPLTARQKELIAAGVKNSSETDIMKQLGIKHWYKDEDFLTASYRLASQPTVNIEGLVSGYTGPGGKTVLPGRAEAKMDFRLVPDMTREEAEAKLKAHLAKRGFGDIVVNVSGGYSPTETDENSVLVKSQIASLKKAKVDYSLNPRLAGSWPGVTFTGPPLKRPAVGFGLGTGGGAHAPDEWYLIDSKNPKVAGLDESAMFYVDYLYELAEAAKR
ncbi:M20/M25/M40 family metallo-hydrolase [Sphingomonas sp. SM33]|uniref:M20/M25/M40 family metallo-hydrolase n=1 Tax=Sphingomonas telluris TaxID=2907998 RepID=A0ABS9VNB6_9SPHN|nr:M20/M25/M40 family metallo-hydrolase [Sphingomonas telluris]MCH8616470.1 M20/M25/M40 family metallo-hydrolase [Sphingomonas telluris]